MSDSTASVTSTIGANSVGTFAEVLRRNSRIRVVVLFIVLYAIYANLLQVGVSCNLFVTFYGGNQARMLIAAIFSTLSLLPGFAAQALYPIQPRTKTQTYTKVQ